MCRAVLIIVLFFSCNTLQAQTLQTVADSLRQKYNVPELAIAVVSADSIYQFYMGGVKKVNTDKAAEVTDRFRIGSNTKAITGFIAAQLVKQGVIKWNTRFFDLFPELKKGSNKANYKLTLLNLLSFRTRLFPYTYTYSQPTQNQFTGNEAQQRYQFTQWFMAQPPVTKKADMHFSNLGYVAAALMIEKASGKTYNDLVQQLGNELGVDFQFGAPNATDSNQTWGHDNLLQPEAPALNYKLGWLQAAGNINVTLPGYIKFIQLQLKGLAGKSNLLSQNEWRFLHFGLPKFAVGWFWATGQNGQPYSYNTGNPGSFLTKVFVYPAANKAYILFANAQTNDTDTCLSELLKYLEKEYK